MKALTSKIAVLLFIIGLSTTFSTYGQGRVKERIQQKKAEIEAERITFYNSTLKLSQEESDKFWPIYKDYVQKQKDVRKNAMKSVKSLKDKSAEELTKEEAGDLIKAEFSVKQSLLDLEKEFVVKFQTAISIQKVAKLKQAENQFKKELVKKAREKKKERMENNR
ncbi:MAG: hypothetical protein WCP69_06310 [Bacteroidota bacterium]